MKVKEVIFILIFLSFSISSCRERKSNNLLINQKLQGCWMGGLLQNDSLTEDVELRLFKIKPDSSLVFSLTYELGPRSRVWEYDIEISILRNEISWLAHQGKLSENLDTMYLTKNWKGEQSQWMFYRDKNYDDFINKFISNTKSDYTYSIPVSIMDSLNCASLDEAGIDTIKMTDFIKTIKTGNLGDIHSILIYRKGKLVLEEYFALEGKISGSFVNETYRRKTHQLSSVTKGILSLVTGIAIEHGNIPGVSEPINTYLRPYSDSFSEDKKQIQIKHLLTMTSGWNWNQFNYSWNDKRNDAANMYKCKDVVEYVLERPMNAEPGGKFNYSNGEPAVMGVVLRNACNVEVDKYTETHLFNPLGITEYKWSRYPDGTLETDGGLKLCSRDLLKAGILMLTNGKWHGNQIISEDWVSESTKSRINLSLKRGYGYYWNEMKYEFRGKSQTAIFIPGDGGQFLGVFPSLDMVIAFTAGIYDKDPTKMYWEIINKNILPALKEK
ncbi:MAG: serine hydrolase [Bacteroidales bacterium]|nr:serine hydrolase [Bacteroidales bacterium]